MKNYGAHLMLLIIGMILLLSFVRSKAVDASIAAPPDPDKIIANICAYCQAKAHSVSLSLADIKQKHLTTATCIKDFRAAINDQQRYKLIGAYVQVASILLKDTDTSIQESGVVMAWQAASCAGDRLKEDVLAADIASTLILPNIALVPNDATEYISYESIMQSLVIVYQRVKADNYVAQCFQSLLASDSAIEDKDAARLVYAAILSHNAQYADALELLRAITSKCVKGEALRAIAEYQHKLDEQQHIGKAGKDGKS